MSQDIIANQPVVIDNGSGFLKAGFAGDTAPALIASSYVGKPKHTRVMVSQAKADDYIGKKAKEHRGLLSINYPLEHGVVTDWTDMEQLWKYTYSELNIRSEDHPVLLTEAPLNPRANREHAAQLFFETFNSPALFISMQAILSLYAAGKLTGVVLDCGDGVSHCVPIYEGFAVQNAIQRNDLAGRDITEHLQLLLRKSGHNFFTTAEKEIVREIKESSCYVALDPTQEELLANDKKSKVHTQYKLPDGTILNLGADRFRAPEILFNPSIVGLEMPGVHNMIDYSVKKCDVDMRKTLYQSIVLSGGSTMTPGFGDRLLKEVHETIKPNKAKIKIFAAPDRNLSTWIGGSILGALDTFKRMWISSAEYAEHGANIVHRKTFL